MTQHARHDEEPIETPGSADDSIVAAALATVPADDGGSSSLVDFARSLLAKQCGVVGGEVGLMFAADPQRGAQGLIATHLERWSQLEEANLGSSIASKLRPLVDRAARESVEHPTGLSEAITLGGDSGMYDAGATHVALASPLSVDGQPHAVSVVLAPSKSRIATTRPGEALELLALLAPAFAAYLWQERCLAEATTKAQLGQTLELLEAAQRGRTAGAMGGVFCDELRRRFGASRVSVGLVKHDRIRLAGVSGADDIAPTGPASEMLEAAMEECADQDAEVLYPPPDELERDPGRRRVTRAHAKLSESAGPSNILSLPLRVDGAVVGVAIMEREASAPFPLGVLPLARLTAEFIGPALWTRRMADRSTLAVMRDDARTAASTLVGPRYTLWKLIALLLLVALVLSAVVPIPGRVSAEAQTRSSESRVVSPPYSGFLESVLVEPGDAVEPGQTLAKLETLELEQDLARSEMIMRRRETERDAALAAGSLSDAEIARAGAAEARAQVDWLRQRIERATLTAPIGGVVGRGELSAVVGARVEPSEPLLEIVDTESLIVLMKVDERDISRVRVGQKGGLVLDGEPGVTHELEVTRISPVAAAAEGKNIYRVEASVVDAPDWMRERPGLSGKAKLHAGTTTALWVIARPLVDEVRLWLWW